MNRSAVRKILMTILVDLALLAVGFFFLLPVVWMLSTSFKTPQQTVAYPPQWIPHPFTVRSFIEGFDGGQFGRYFRNTASITLLTTVGTLLSCSLVAFGFAKLKARLKGVLFMVVLATMMIPGTVTLIPMYVIYSNFGWIDTYLPLVAPSFFGANAFSIFLLRQFFASIPHEIAESAMLDGCTWPGILLRLYIPNSKPALLVVAIFSFVGAWNDYFGPMIYLTTPGKFTVSIGLQAFRSMYGGAADLGPLMAMSLVCVFPIIVLYLFCQRYFIEGVVTSGIKG